MIVNPGNLYLFNQILKRSETQRERETEREREREKFNQPVNFTLLLLSLSCLHLVDIHVNSPILRVVIAKMPFYSNTKLASKKN